MSNYRRARVPGASYFFTVNLRDRRSDLLVREIDLLRATVRATRARHPFHIDAWVVPPEHMHCIWTLPAGDRDFARRWQIIKAAFSRRLPQHGTPNSAQAARGERGEHLIRDDLDCQRHFDYLHYNPVKHSHVARVVDWPWSSFHRAVRAGIYTPDWAGDGGDVRAGHWGE
ncbi:REP-associated tyrosine transposase [Pseudomonas oryzae]|uniref:Putative transposase n=1 Tax=Pseudomonas oryzae TaxID=1392877 RepID=A0A1H1TS32_9PSED|nr:transposase [Pseudomonas oryzae]SDS62934.1 putative transposase [Pseudomonas oryzae]